MLADAAEDGEEQILRGDDASPALDRPEAGIERNQGEGERWIHNN
jgi:hypothetical protein